MRGLAECGASLQRVGVSDVLESVRKWRGLVCPDCRFVFRVPEDHVGKGVACPSCRRLLRIPGAGDETPPLVASANEGPAARVPQGRVGRRRRIATTESWDEDRGGSRGGNVSSGWMRWYLVLAVLVLVVLVVWLVMTMGNDPKSFPQRDVPTVERKEETVSAGKVDAMQPWNEGKEVEALCREFVSATTVDQILSLIRDRERLETVVRSHYIDGKVPARGFAEMNLIREFGEGDRKAATFMVLTKDLKRVPLNVRQMEDGLKVDWESWVGYSSMSWTEIMEKMPVEPVLVRVMLSDVPYYNMDFADDTKWRSCRMLSPNGEHVLYGYVRKGSEEKKQLFRLTSSDPSAESYVSLMIRYPQDAKSPNQVIVDRVVADSWLISETKP